MPESFINYSVTHQSGLLLDAMWEKQSFRRQLMQNWADASCNLFSNLYFLSWPVESLKSCCRERFFPWHPWHGKSHFPTSWLNPGSLSETSDMAAFHGTGDKEENDLMKLPHPCRSLAPFKFAKRHLTKKHSYHWLVRWAEANKNQQSELSIDPNRHWRGW